MNSNTTNETVSLYTLPVPVNPTSGPIASISSLFGDLKAHSDSVRDASRSKGTQEQFKARPIILSAQKKEKKADGTRDKELTVAGTVENLLLLLGEVSTSLYEKAEFTQEPELLRSISIALASLSLAAGEPAKVKAEEKAEKAKVTAEIVGTSVAGTAAFLSSIPAE